jgi:Transmembrane protein 65
MTMTRRIDSAPAVVVPNNNNNTIIPSPTSEQYKLVFLHAAIPMIGFGMIDQTIMLHAGDAIDCTIGVTFGLST